MLVPVGDRITSDNMGPITPLSVGKHRHIVTFLELQSRILVSQPIVPSRHYQQENKHVVTFLDLQSRFTIDNPIISRSGLITLITPTLQAIFNHHQNHSAICYLKTPETVWSNPYNHISQYKDFNNLLLYSTVLK